MSNGNSERTIYESRRQARGGDRPPPPRRWRRRIVAGSIALTCAVGIGVAAYVHWMLTHVTTVRAAVQAAVAPLSPDADARLRELCVSAGQQVIQGQLLAKLDDSDARAALAAAEAGRTTAQARVASARAALELRQVQLPEEVRRAEANRNEAEARLAHLKMGSRSEEIEAAKLRLATAQALATLYEGDVQWTEELIKRGFESRHTLAVQQTQLATQKNVAREAELTLARLLAGTSAEEIEAQEQIKAARDAALALARAGSKEVQALAADLAAREAELEQAQANVAGCRSVLDRMSLISPVSGTVIRTLARPGELCRKGAPTILVSDDAAGRWIEGLVREEDAARVKVGQHATVELIVGSRNYAGAAVEAVGLATSSLSRSNFDLSADSMQRSAGEMVWVKLRLAERKGDPLPGMSARAIIRVR